jgi:importin subunit beta-1
MNASNERIALQAIEFWCTICDQEYDLRLEAEEARQDGTSPQHVSKFYALGALPYLLGVLLVLLTYQVSFFLLFIWYFFTNFLIRNL